MSCLRVFAPADKQLTVSVSALMSSLRGLPPVPQKLGKKSLSGKYMEMGAMLSEVGTGGDAKPEGKELLLKTCLGHSYMAPMFLSVHKCMSARFSSQWGWTTSVVERMGHPVNFVPGPETEVIHSQVHPLWLTSGLKLKCSLPPSFFDF